MNNGSTINSGGTGNTVPNSTTINMGKVVDQPVTLQPDGLDVDPKRLEEGRKLQSVAGTSEKKSNETGRGSKVIAMTGFLIGEAETKLQDFLSQVQQDPSNIPLLDPGIITTLKDANSPILSWLQPREREAINKGMAKYSESFQRICAKIMEQQKKVAEDINRVMKRTTIV